MIEGLAPMIDGLTIHGALNTPDVQVIAQVRAAIRRQYPQAFHGAVKGDRIALVGGGPSLAATERELVAMIHAGAKLVTVNGAYQWCLDRNLRPAAQVVIDARDFNARFLEPEVPECRYYLASQCHPALWDAVEGRPYVCIFHAVATDGDVGVRAELDSYYLGRWQGVAGGTTVMTRALGLLRMLGWLRFDLFGVDSCWLPRWRLRRGAGVYHYGGLDSARVLTYGTEREAADAAAYLANDYGEDGWVPECIGEHHAYPQPENAGDRPLRVTVAPPDRPDLARQFIASPWMIKQAEDVLMLVRHLGDELLINVHGDGMIAYMLRTAAETVEVRED